MAIGAVSGFRATPAGDCASDPMRLPAIVLKWNQVIPGGDVFVRYDVYRAQPSVSAAFTRVATFSTIGTITWTDYEVISNEVYRYYIVWVAQSGVISPQVYVLSRVRFDFLWLHDRVTPARATRFDSWDADIAVTQDTVLRNPWGRQTPTLFIGTIEARTAHVGGLDQLLTDRRRWDELQTLVTAQRVNASTIVARWGRAREMMYCQIMTSQKTHSQKAYVESIGLSEVYATVGV